MKKVYPFAFLCLSFFCQTAYAQEEDLKVYFREGWYRMMNGKKALEVVVKDNKITFRLAKKRDSPNQFWKLTLVNEDSHILYYRLTVQSFDENKVLAVAYLQDTLCLQEATLPQKGICQTWAIVPVYGKTAMDNRQIVMNTCRSPMDHLTYHYKNKQFIWEFNEETQPNQIWRFEPVK